MRSLASSKAGWEMRGCCLFTGARKRASRIRAAGAGIGFLRALLTSCNASMLSLFPPSMTGTRPATHSARGGDLPLSPGNHEFQGRWSSPASRLESCRTPRSRGERVLIRCGRLGSQVFPTKIGYVP